MPEPTLPSTPADRDSARRRLRVLTRGAIVAATGATVAMGVVVANDRPGAGAVHAAASTTSAAASATGSSSTSTSDSGTTGTTGTTGNTGTASTTTTTTTAPTRSSSSPTVTSGATS